MQQLVELLLRDATLGYTLQSLKFQLLLLVHVLSADA